MAHGKVIEVDKYVLPFPPFDRPGEIPQGEKESPQLTQYTVQPRHLQSPDILRPSRRRLLRHLVRALQGRCSCCRQAQRNLLRCALHPG